MADPSFTRRLFLLRHAKSSWARPGDPDHDRPLAPRGARALPGVADAIDRLLDAPLDLVLGSTALRVQSTLAGVLPRISKPHEVRRLPALYLADPARLLAELNEVPDGVRSVLLCGHNPGLQQLAYALVEGDDSAAGLPADFPTAALAVIDLDDEWADVGDGSGRLVAFIAPKK